MIAPSDLAAGLAALEAAGVPSPGADVRWLAEHVEERDGDVALFKALVTRRVAREPLQLILGEAWFRYVRVACRPGVFIPRPETEIVAGVAIDWLRALGRPTRVVEPCTGTGVITCALVTEVPGVEVVAVELDEAPFLLATENVAAALAGDAGHPPASGVRAEVRRGDLLGPVDLTWQGSVDAIVSNPPYLPASDEGSWDPEVGAHDPVGALVGGAHGNELVDRLLVDATSWLRPGGLVVLELDPRLAGEAAETATAVGLVDVALVRDLTGRDRAVRARKSGGDDAA